LKKQPFQMILTLIAAGTLPVLSGAPVWAATASCQSQHESKLDCMEFSGILPAPLRQVCTIAGQAQWVDSPCPQENVLGYCDVSRTDSIRQRVYCYRMAQVPTAQRIEFCRKGCQGIFAITEGQQPAPQTNTVTPSTRPTEPSMGTAAARSSSPRTTNPAASLPYAMEQNTNRYGEDYKDLSLPTANPALCARACMAEARCLAWTYVKPGVQADNALCWLKDQVPLPTPDDNCISGVKTTGTSEPAGAPSGTAVHSQTYRMENGVDLPGDDYRDFDLDTPDPGLCAHACMADAPCKSWTYVKPGVQADDARCWLKDSVPAPSTDENCVSGVK